MFDCPRAHSLMVSGPKESTCVEEGYWKPDPKQVQCKGGCLKKNLCLSNNISIR